MKPETIQRDFGATQTRQWLRGSYIWKYGGTTGWIELNIPDVQIDADAEYTVSISTGTSLKRNYPNMPADLQLYQTGLRRLTLPDDLTSHRT